MNLSPFAIKSWRLASQKLLGDRLVSPSQVAAWLGGVQAQDHRWGLWSIGLRIGGATAARIEQALHDRQVVRTWLFRGTLHFVAAQDLGWLTALLAPGIIQGNARRYRQLELDAAAFTRSRSILQRAIEDSGSLTRAEIKKRFLQHGLPAEGQQLPYLLQRLALDGLICHGPLRGSEPTYTLISDWIGALPTIDRAEALARLAARYFTSHGPAQLQDFAWWSGLSAREARQALESASSLTRLAVGGIDYWAAGDPPSGSPECAHLLPPFDEYLLGYKDRSLALDPTFTKQVNAGGGMPKPTVMLDGEIIGIWTYEFKKTRLLISIHPFQPLESRARRRIAQAADELGSYLGKSVEIHFTT